MSELSPSAVKSVFDRITSELGKVIVGQDHIVRGLLVSLFARGHTLLIGVPGLAKTLLVKSLADTAYHREVLRECGHYRRWAKRN